MMMATIVGGRLFGSQDYAVIYIYISSYLILLECT